MLDGFDGIISRYGDTSKKRVILPVMRLEKIKLSGFKSFVDSTTVPVVGNLIGIVGPNGCGKSNIIDAVRWVMGESSAKHLRGGTMADVIFNGSSTRKPIGKAAIELTFDNSEGRAGEEYAQYNTLSIKREVTRDGQSVYHLNGSRCRRKDVTDLFLGTGLGPRSYAIIEQGTISRLVEAKAEDLRVFIEEAAGISKYKDRRREAETRIRNTRENLERLEDLRSEVDRQLESLKRQAKKAEKYTTLKQRERLFREQLLAMRWSKFDAEVKQFDDKIKVMADDLNRIFVEKKQIEESLETIQKEYREKHQAVDQIQGDYYSLGADISRLEQQIQHVRTNKAEAKVEMERLSVETENVKQDLERDRQQLDTLAQELEETEKALEEALLVEEEASEQQRESNENQQDWRSKQEDIVSKLTEKIQQVEIQSTRLTQFERQVEQLTLREQRLQIEHTELTDSYDDEEMDALEQGIELVDTERAEVRQKLDETQGHIQAQRETIKKSHIELAREREEYQDNKGKIASLFLLQQHAMGRDRPVLAGWLERMALTDAPRLAQHLEVEADWENAVEMVLGSYLEAVCVEDARELLEEINAIAGEALTVFETRKMPEHDGITGKNLLLEKICSPWNLYPLLSGIYCAENLQFARQQSTDLEPHESIVTKEGYWLGQGWLMARQEDGEKAGMLQREKELRALKIHQQELSEAIENLDACGREAEGLLHAGEGEREELQQRDQLLTEEIADKNSRLSAFKARQEQVKERLTRLDIDRNELVENREQLLRYIEEARLLKEQAREGKVILEEDRAELQGQSDEIADRAKENDSIATTAREKLQVLKLRHNTLHSSNELTVKQLQRTELQYEKSQQQQQLLEEKTKQSDTPLKDEIEQLEDLRLQRLEIEQNLVRMREETELGEAQVKKLNEDRIRLERVHQEKREQMDQERLQQQERQVRRQTIGEQLGEMDASIDEVTQSLPDDADEKAWHKKVEELGTKIEGFGSINLAAIEECGVQAERLEYLDSQNSDLSESLETLEQAIARIDRESRSRFKDTFDRINENLESKFPKLFGGGRAQLELTEQNLLEAGVNIMAHPPGKRNSSIHLLSGGEKALTAVALVFSIFELNPAPFCLLDEVDAPLDDANVGRFSQLVEEMSESVQFIFITHNKATMEIAKELIGVTMKEPGVSKMVTVDMQEAVELAIA